MTDVVEVVIGGGTTINVTVDNPDTPKVVEVNAAQDVSNRALRTGSNLTDSDVIAFRDDAIQALPRAGLAAAKDSADFAALQSDAEVAAIFLQNAQTYATASVPTKPWSGPGTLSIGGVTVMGADGLKLDAYGNLFSQPQIYGERLNGPYGTPDVSGGEPFSNTLITVGGRPLYAYANDPTNVPSGRIWRSAAFGYGVLQAYDSVELCTFMGHENAKYLRYGTRVNAFGSNGPQWGGRDLRKDLTGADKTADPTWDYYRHPIYWDGSAVTKPGDPSGITRFGAETANPGIGAAVAALDATTWATSRDDLARVDIFGRDAGLALSMGSDIALFGYRAGCLAYKNVADLAFFGPYAGQSAIFVKKGSAFGSHAGESWQEGEGSLFGAYQAGSGVVKSTDALALGRNAAYGIWQLNKSVILGPYAGQNLPGYTTIGGAALENVFLLHNDVGSTTPLMSGLFAAQGSVPFGIGIGVKLFERLATFHVRTAASGLTAVATGASQGLFEGDTTAGVTIAGGADLSLSFARPAITSPATVAQRQYSAYIRATMDATTGLDDMVFGLNSSGVGRWRNGSFLVSRTSASTSATGAGWVFTATGFADSHRTGTSNQAHIRFFNGSDATPTQVGSISTSGSATTYATSSDYRLKRFAVTYKGAAKVIDAVKIRQWIWNKGGLGVGVIAHELAEVIPEAVVGEKDAVDEKGNPIYQGVDQSKIVPYLVAYVQQMKAQVDAIERRLPVGSGAKPTKRASRKPRKPSA
jgi:hypothetical protein